MKLGLQGQCHLSNYLQRHTSCFNIYVFASGITDVNVHLTETSIVIFHLLTEAFMYSSGICALLQWTWNAPFFKWRISMHLNTDPASLFLVLSFYLILSFFPSVSSFSMSLLLPISISSFCLFFYSLARHIVVPFPFLFLFLLLSLSSYISVIPQLSPSFPPF